MNGVAIGEMRFVLRPRSDPPALLLLVYALPILICLYGLTCIVEQEGRLPVRQKFASKYGFHLRTVRGDGASLAGLGYVSLAIFGALSIGNPPPAKRKWMWRAGRGVARWGSLLFGFWAWQMVYERLGMGSPWPTVRTADDVRALLAVASCFGIFALLCFLFALYQREAVKRELNENGCVSRHIWWLPAAYWNMLSGAAAFRVIYQDPAGALHQAHCSVRRPWLGSAWATRGVRWLQDEIIQERLSPESWVFVDSDIVRPRLK